MDVGALAVAVEDHDEEWEIEIDEKRPRPTGAVSGHHVDDLVLRATRHTC